MLNYQNLLPYDGAVYYEKNLWNKAEASQLLDQMMRNLYWQHDEIIMFGKKITTGRKVAWYGDEPYTYTYSRTTKEAIPWHRMLIPVKDKTEEFTRAEFNACLCNLYHHGNEGMSWHSDDDKEFGNQPIKPRN
jgi:alkylated DNA repair dioxygenase AlkB